MALDLSSFDAMLKNHYSPKTVMNLATQENILFGLLKKSASRELVGGRNWIQPIQIALPGGGSSNFAKAMAATNNNSLYKAFTITRSKHYRLARIDNETIEATATGKQDAFEPAFDEFDNAIEAEANYINFRLFRGAGGSIGRMTNASFATTTLTLDDPSGVWGIRQGDVLRLTPNADGSSLRTGTLTVASVTRTGPNAGQVVLTGNISAGVAAAAASDYVIIDGDEAGACSGLADWCPDAAPTSTLFFGVDRTVEPDYLGGIRIDATDGRSVPNALMDVTAAIQNLGKNPNTVIMNPLTFAATAKQMDGKWVITQPAGYGQDKVASAGFSALEVNLGGASLKIYQDRCCPVKKIYTTDLSTWTLFSAGAAPNFLQKRAGSILKVSENYDGYEARVGEYYNLSNSAPGYTGVILLP